MAQPPGPTVRRMQLGWELSRLRHKAQFTLADAVNGLSFSASKLYRVENGLTSLKSTAHLQSLLERYGVTNNHDVNFLIEVQQESLKRGWWAPYRSVMPSGMAMYVGLESGARAIRSWQPSLVLGLLQNERYTRHMLLTAKPVEEHTTEVVERTIEVRRERKENLTRPGSDQELWAVLDEAALRRVIGSPEVMRVQYEEIIKLSALDNVTVQILPMATATYRCSFNFTLLEFESPLPRVVESDVAEGANVSDKDTTVWAFSRRFDALRAGALAPSETPDFLHRLVREI